MSQDGIEPIEKLSIARSRVKICLSEIAWLSAGRVKRRRPLSNRMHDPNSLREQARSAAFFSKTTVEPEVIEQLCVWAVELAEEADQAEWRAFEGEVQPTSNQ
jgi:hypothetical protein